VKAGDGRLAGGGGPGSVPCSGVSFASGPSTMLRAFGCGGVVAVGKTSPASFVVVAVAVIRLRRTSRNRPLPLR